jgi:hypothetical protein
MTDEVRRAAHIARGANRIASPIARVNGRRTRESKSN